MNSAKNAGKAMIYKILFFCLLTVRLYASDGYSIVVENSNPHIADQLLEGLQAYNVEFFKQNGISTEMIPFAICAKDDNGNLIGGLCGLTFASSIHVDYAYVDLAWRGKGIGTSLFNELEVYAKDLGYESIQLFTFEYQAVGFYEKLGYTCVGIIPNWVNNKYHTYFYKKNL